MHSTSTSGSAIAAGVEAEPDVESIVDTEPGDVHQRTEPRTEREALLDGRPTDVADTTDAGQRRGHEVDRTGLCPHRRREHTGRQMADRRRQHLRHVQRRLPTGSGQSLGNDSEQRAGMPVRDRNLHPGRHDRTPAARTDCASGRETRAETLRQVIPRRSWYSPRPIAAPATRRSFRLPPSASAVARAPGTENASNRLLIDRDGDNGDNRPPVTTTCRETELATSKLRWTPRTTASTGSIRIAAATPLATPLAIGCTAPARSMVTLTVPGFRRDSAPDDESISPVTTASRVGSDASTGRVGSRSSTASVPATDSSRIERTSDTPCDPSIREWWARR